MAEPRHLPPIPTARKPAQASSAERMSWGIVGIPTIRGKGSDRAMRSNYCHHSVDAVPASTDRLFAWTVALASLVVLATATWLVGLDTQRRVAPMGQATPAGPRHADEQSTRVASLPPEERHNILLCQGARSRRAL